MKIISKEKDYYDFLMGKYGRDPKIVFDRTKLLPDTDWNKLDFFHRHVYNPIFSYRVLVVCGKRYPLIGSNLARKISGFRLVDEKDLQNKYIVQDLRSVLNIMTGWLDNNKLALKNIKSCLAGTFDNKLIGISKQIGSPIFVINSRQNETFIIDQHVPILSKIEGFPAVYPAEKIFTDLAFFIGNVLNNNVDDTHLIISDKDKIIKGGFSLVTSFRGRQ